jgi:hypothetical protein
MRTSILLLSLTIVFSQSLLAETPETTHKCRSNSVEVLVQKIENEERVVVIKKDSAASYHKCRKEQKNQDVHIKCQGDDQAADIDFTYTDIKKSAKLKSGFLGLSKKLKCRAITKSED